MTFTDGFKTATVGNKIADRKVRKRKAINTQTPYCDKTGNLQVSGGWRISVISVFVTALSLAGRWMDALAGPSYCLDEGRLGGRNLGTDFISGGSADTLLCCQRSHMVAECFLLGKRGFTLKGMKIPTD